MIPSDKINDIAVTAKALAAATKKYEERLAKRGAIKHAAALAVAAKHIENLELNLRLAIHLSEISEIKQ